MKIDTAKIEGFEAMTAEQKLAALMEFDVVDDAAAAESARLRAALDKANSEAASWKHKHNDLLTDDQKKQQENAERLTSMEEELKTLRREKTVAGFKASYIAQGFSEELAAETSEALADGKMDIVFANSKKAVEEHDAKLRAEILKNTPRPAPGSANGGVDYQKKIDEARKNHDFQAEAYYTRLLAQEQAKQS